MPPKAKNIEEENEEENEEDNMAGMLHELEEEVRGQRATIKVLTIENNTKLREIAACEAEIQVSDERRAVVDRCSSSQRYRLPSSVLVK